MKDIEISLDILTNTSHVKIVLTKWRSYKHSKYPTSVMLYQKFVIEVKQNFTIINKSYKRKSKVDSITS